MKYKYLNHIVENGRLILKFKATAFFGLINKEIECIDSNMTYALFNTPVWYKYPSFEKISSREKLVNACENTKKRLFHEKKIKIVDEKK